jgi:hypothetical protein
VPRRLQGRYVGYRNRLVVLSKLAFAAGLTGIIALLPEEQGLWGLQIVLVIAGLSRTASVWLLYRQPEPDPRPAPKSKDSQHLAASGGLMHFLRNLTRSEMGRWTIVWASLQFGVALSSGPYLVSYMIAADPDGLNLTAWPYFILLYTATVTRLAVMPFVGRLIELFGPSAMLRVAVAGIVLVPVPWALSRSLGVLVASEMFSGLCWCIAEVAVGVLLFSCHRHPDHRARLIGYHQSVVTLAGMLAAITGSLLLAKDASSATHETVGHLLPTILGSPYHALFLLGAAARLPALVLAWRLLPSLRTLRDDEHEDLWRTLPGTAMAMSFGRGLIGYFRRPDD